MIKNIVFSCIFCIAAAVFVIKPCYGQAISGIELINNAKQYDAKKVSFKGEVVGDIMNRGDYAWLCLNDGYVAMGIWVPKELLKDIQYVGGYKTKGDIIEASGVFNRACPEHGGDLDIHAQTINKISSGEIIAHKINTNAIKIAVGTFLAILAACLLKRLRLGTVLKTI